MSVSVPVFITDPPMSGDGDVVEDDDNGMDVDVLVDEVGAEAETEAETEAVWEIEGEK